MRSISLCQSAVKPSPRRLIALLGSFLGCFLLLGCSTTAPLKPAKAGPIRLELKGQQGQVDTTRYYSHSRIQNYEEDQMVRARDEIVDFKVKEL
ncbi:MAG: hypothetical protein AB7N80_14695, partial [Bdellovibrionales bacterium]